MPQLPLNIDMHGRKALVVGGGQVASRKVAALLAAGAAVRVVAPEAKHALHELAVSGQIELRLGNYRSDDLDGVFLVASATDSRQVNSAVAAEAAARGLLVTVSDAPELGNCIFPAVLRRGDLEISVSTGGGCPAFAAHVRDVLAGLIGPEYGLALERLAAERDRLLASGSSSACNAVAMRASVRREIEALAECETKA